MRPELNAIKHLALYHYRTCPFCVYTRRVIAGTRLDVESCNIQENKQHKKTLTQEGGKAQVPCLRIDYQNGQSVWLYESQDIARFAKGLDKLNTFVA